MLQRTASSTPPLSQALTALAALDVQIEALEQKQAQDVTALAGEISGTELLLDGARESLRAYDSARSRAEAHEQAHARLLSGTAGGASAAPATTARLVGDAARRLAAQAQVSVWEQRRNAAQARVTQLESRLAGLRARQEVTQSVFSDLLTGLRRDRSAQIERLVAETAPVELTPPPPPTEEELKALRAAIRRDEWADLPAFYGTEQLPQRECLNCGALVPAGRKRFCSRDCQQMHLYAYGSTTMPRGGGRD